jgi:stringent starvation protein B
MSDVPQQPPTRPDAPRTPRKKDVAITLLEGPSLFVHLDPRKPGVVVPPRFKEEYQLMLQVGMNMAISIPDLKVDDTGITCTLSFSQRPFWCSIPWTAVYALVGEDSRGMLWPDDVPPELATQMRNPQPAGPKAVPAKKPRPKLAAVEPEDELSAARKKAEPRRALEAVPPARSGRGGGRRQGNAAMVEGPGAPAARPALAAVPPAAPSGAGQKQGPMPPILRSEEEGEAAPAENERTPALAPGKKAKRELPPYLRVIK